MKRLVAARIECEGWEPAETAGTADEQTNPTKFVDSTRSAVQEILRLKGSLSICHSSCGF